MPTILREHRFRFFFYWPIVLNRHMCMFNSMTMRLTWIIHWNVRCVEQAALAWCVTLADHSFPCAQCVKNE